MKFNILIPGAGAASSIGVIKSLRAINFDGKIITTDSNPLSAGFYLADKYYVLPKSREYNFFEEAMKIIKKEKINIIFPTGGYDIVEYSRHKKELESLGIIVVISNLVNMAVCMSKWEFYKRLKDKFPLPKVFFPDEVIEFPCFIKPVHGKGSRNCFMCKDRTELDFYLSRHRDMLIQEYLPGTEYSIDVLADLNGKPIIAVPRIRVETKAGISVKGKVIHHEGIQKACMDVSKYLGLIGPSCMQMKMDKDNNPKFIEVNPRMGGGTIFTDLAGINIPKMILDMASNKEIVVGLKDFKEITVLRYFEEVIMGGKNV